MIYQVSIYIPWHQCLSSNINSNSISHWMQVTTIYFHITRRPKRNSILHRSQYHSLVLNSLNNHRSLLPRTALYWPLTPLTSAITSTVYQEAISEQTHNTFVRISPSVKTNHSPPSKLINNNVSYRSMVSQLT